MKAKLIEDFEIVDDYRDEIIGKSFDGKYGRFTVLGATNKKLYSNRLFVCEFKYSGYKNIYKKQAIINGSILDPYYPSICSVACSGLVPANHFLYSVWNSMIHRCYNQKKKDYKYYGAKGVTVCDRWLCFENFIEDAMNIKGWDEEKFKLGLLQLDKDKSNGKKYSLLYCEWISKKDNVDIANENQRKKQKKFIAINISTKQEVLAQGLQKFSRDYGVAASNIKKCLDGDYKQCNGWFFKWYDDVLDIEETESVAV